MSKEAQRRRANQDGRGRQAEDPRQIPARGWKDIALRVKDEIGRDHLTLVAAGVTFYALLALFPMVAALVSIYGLIADPATIESQVEALRGVLPGGGVDIIEEQLSRVSEKGEGKLGFVFLGGLLLSLWSANKGMKAMFEAMNIAYDEEEERGFFKVNLISLLFTVGAIALVVFALLTVMVLPVLLGNLGFGDIVREAIAWLRWPLLFVGVVIAIALVYRYGPSRRKPEWRWVTFGGIGAGVIFIVASLLFSWYAANFGSFNETYGSLGGAIGLMTWIWISTLIVLIGAEVNAEMEHQTTVDTTAGEDRPIGERDAVVADTVGEASNA